MKIRVPATSANLGPGFDSLGIAIALYNEVNVKPSSYHSVSIKGEGSDNARLKTNNLFLSIFSDIYRDIKGDLDTFRFEFYNHIPFSRGLGSSSAVIVSAIALAYEMAGVKIGKKRVLNKALFYESHPDNISPAVYGGFVSSVVDNNEVYSIKKELPSNLKVIMVIPNRAMSTSHSRRRLPKSYPMENIVYNLSRSSFLSAAFFSENWDMLKVASKDCLHESVRISSMPKLEEVREVALNSGALMSTLSGSGSSFFSLVYEEDAQNIANILRDRFQKFRVEIFDLDNDGYKIYK